MSLSVRARVCGLLGFAGTCANNTAHGRLMSHWGFKVAGDAIAATAPAATGRMRFEHHLTPRLIASLCAHTVIAAAACATTAGWRQTVSSASSGQNNLTPTTFFARVPVCCAAPAQKRVLRIGRQFDLDPVFEKERRASAGKVWWGMADEAVAAAHRPAFDSTEDPSPDWSKTYAAARL